MILVEVQFDLHFTLHKYSYKLHLLVQLIRYVPKTTLKQPPARNTKMRLKRIKWYCLVFLITAAFSQLRTTTTTLMQDEEKVASIPIHDGKDYAKFVMPTSSTKATRHHDCWRDCPQRKNVIFFEYNRAGLSDRYSIIKRLAQLAGYLCARVELPPPSFLLNPRHNHGLDISRDIVWQEFNNITFRKDNSSVFVDQYSSSFDQNFTDWHKIPVYDKEKYSDWFYILSSNAADTLKDYERIQNFSWHQEENSTTGFIWEIRTNMYQAALVHNILPEPSLDIRNNSKYSIEMQPMHSVRNSTNQHILTPQCNYIQSFQPTEMQLLSHRIKERVHSLSLQNSTYGHFHIRRGGGAKLTCNTTITEIRNFLQCSLNGTERFGKNITILMGSDETDESYRQTVISLSEHYSHVQILDADKIVSDVLRDSIQRGIIDKKFDNNFHIFDLQNDVLKYPFASFLFRKRRKIDCMSCSPLLGKDPFVDEVKEHQT